jgi:RimJ/RimL family protein N-acetyltransferase
MPETKDLILRKGLQSDWKAMYENIWCHPESARFMLWDVTTSEAEAYARMERTLRFQASHDFHWTVVERKSGQAIGFAGLEILSEGVCGETGIAIGPAFTGKGYGKQILNALTDYAKKELGAKIFIACCRSRNEASRRMQLACGFRFNHTEDRTDPRNDEPYILEYYEKDL